MEPRFYVQCQAGEGTVGSDGLAGGRKGEEDSGDLPMSRHQADQSRFVPYFWYWSQGEIAIAKRSWKEATPIASLEHVGRIKLDQSMSAMLTMKNALERADELEDRAWRIVDGLNGKGASRERALRMFNQ